MKVIGTVLIDRVKAPAEHIPFIPRYLDIILDTVLSGNNRSQSQLVTLFHLIGNIQGLLVLFGDIAEFFPSHAVVMGGYHINIGLQLLYHGMIPLCILFHAACHQMNAFIHFFHRFCKLGGRAGVFLRCHAFHLPDSVHFIA